MHTNYHAKYYVKFYTLIALAIMLTSTPTIYANIRHTQASNPTAAHQADMSLLLALKNEQLDVAKKLIEEKPELINTYGPRGITPLIVAAAKGYTEIVELLIAHGANIHTRIEKGHTALTLAALTSNRDDNDTSPSIDRTTIVRALILAGADASILDKPTLPSSMQTIIASAEQQYAQHVRVTLETATQKNSSLSTQEIATLNALLLNAAIQGDHDTVSAIFKLGVANIETSDSNGNTLLLLAIEHKRELLVNDLLAQQANVNAQSRGNGHTALIKACMVNSPKIVSALLSYHADINAQDLNGLTPLHWAALHTNDGNNTAILEILLNLDQKRTHKVALESAPQKGLTPLMMAAISKNTEAIKLLIKAGADTTIIDIQAQHPTLTIDPAIRRLIAQLEKEQHPGLLSRFKNALANLFTHKTK